MCVCVYICRYEYSRILKVCLTDKILLKMASQNGGNNQIWLPQNIIIENKSCNLWPHLTRKPGQWPHSAAELNQQSAQSWNIAWGSVWSWIPACTWSPASGNIWLGGIAWGAAQSSAVADPSLQPYLNLESASGNICWKAQLGAPPDQVQLQSPACSPAQ